MDVVPPPPPSPPSPADSGTERAIRFAVYLTGGLVVLSFGLLYVTSDIGQILNCLFTTDYCSSGFSEAIYFETIPGLVGGMILVVIAIILLLRARQVR